MKKLLFFLAVLVSTAAFAQTDRVKVKTAIITDSLKLGGKWYHTLDSIGGSNDTIFVQNFTTDSVIIFKSLRLPLSDTTHMLRRKGFALFDTLASHYYGYDGNRFLCLDCDSVGVTGGGDGNNYPSSLNFNSTTGGLTLQRNGLSDLTTNLDGRYLQNTGINNTDDVPEGSINHYWTNDRFDARLASKSTSDLAEGGNLYYTDTRARLALSASPPLSYNNSTGGFTISQATTSTNGYLSSTDWNTFNNKVSMVYPGAGIPLSTGSAWGTSITDNSINWNTAYTNRITSLTTTGNSGAATLSSNVLNIPNYTIDGILPSQTGNNGKALTTNGSVASWNTVSAVPAGSNTEIQYNNSGAFGSSSNFNYTSSVLNIQRNSIGTTVTNGLLLENSTASTSGVTAQGAPVFVQRSHVWRTFSTGSDNTIDWILQGTGTSFDPVKPVYTIGASIAGGATTQYLTLGANGNSIRGDLVITGSGILVTPTIWGAAGATNNGPIVFNNSMKVFASSGNVQIAQDNGLQTDRLYRLYVDGDLSTSGVTVIQALSTPVASASYSGTTGGGATYKYKAVAFTAHGEYTDASAEVTATTNGATTLNGSNRNTINVTAVRGASYYKIYRTVAGGTGNSGTTGVIAILTAGQFNAAISTLDQGTAGDGTTPPTVNITGLANYKIWRAITMTTAQRTGYTPAEGDTVYDSDLHKLETWDGTAWQAHW